MSKEYLEALENIMKIYGNTNSLEGTYDYFLIIKKALQRLESIDNAKPSEALAKLEMLSDCAEAMKEAPSSNWIEYANSEVELDYQLWIAYEDLKQYILKAQEQEKVIEIIKKHFNIRLLVEETKDNYVWGRLVMIQSKQDEGTYDTTATANLVDYKEEFELLKKILKP